jgi:hypothetical protein
MAKQVKKRMDLNQLAKSIVEQATTDSKDKVKREQQKSKTFQINKITH